MINLNNETDYKILNKTNNFYNFFIYITIFLFLSIIIKLFFIYIEKTESKVVTNYNNSLEFLPSIYDTHGNTLAYSDFNYSTYRNDDKFIYLKRDISPIDRHKVLFQSDPSIKFQKILTRRYPYESIIPNFLGKVDIDHKGISLLEGKLNSQDEDIHLSINLQIQQKIFNSLQKDTFSLNPDYSLNILIDLSKEEIISNVFIDNQDKPFDKSFMPLKDTTFEFGSVFKPFTVYSAIKNNKINLEEYFNVDEPVYIGKKLVKDFIPSQIPYQVKDILKKSSNRGAVLIRRKLDCQKEFKKDLKEMGLLQPTNIGFDLISTNPIVNNFRGSYCDNIPYGYGISVSPIQLINAYGKIITGRDDFQASIKKNNYQKENNFNLHSNTINKLLFYANESQNDLYQNFLVAGKTGTADKTIKNTTFQNVAYISYFPYNDPKYLSLTFMQNPKNKFGPFMTAGNTVKPVFYNILKKIYMDLDLTILDFQGTDI
tara:strand:+ start:2271 stop:3725 length:1455 start_codon:yes stop_codon:yes gene_type:complete